MNPQISGNRIRLVCLAVAMMTGLLASAQAGVRTAIGSWRLITSSSSMDMSMGDYSWPSANEQGAGTLFVNAGHVLELDEGGEYVIEVTAVNAGDHTVLISPPHGYAAYIEGVERNAYLINGATSGTTTTSVRFFIQKKWNANPGFVAKQSGDSGDELGESGPLTLGYPTTESSSGVPHLEFNMGRSRNGTPLPKLVSFNTVARTYAGVDATVTGTWPLTIETPQVTAVMTNVRPSWASVLSSATWWLSFSLPGQTGSPFLGYEFHSEVVSVSTTHQVAQHTYTKFYLDSGRKYEMRVTYGPSPKSFSDNIWGDRHDMLIEDWHEIAPNSTGPSRYVHLDRTYDNSTWQVQDYIRVSANSDLSNPTSVTTNVYHAYPYLQFPDANGYYRHYFRLASSTQHGATQDYTLSTVDKFDPYTTGHTQADGSTEIQDLSPDTGMIPNNLPSKIYRSWLDASPSKADGQPVNANNALVESRLYSFDWAGAYVLPTSVRQHAAGTLLSEATLVHSQEGSGTINGDYVQVVTRYDFVAPGSTGNSTTQRTITDGASLKSIVKTYRADSDYRANQPYSVESPDGTKRSYVYELGTYDTGSGSFTPGSASSDLDVRITTLNGVAPTSGGLTSYGGQTIDAISLIPLKSTKTVQVLKAGRLVRVESYIYNNSSAFESSPASWQTMTYNDSGRLTGRQGSDNTSYATTWADHGRKLTEYSEEGLVTTFGYDSMDRVVSVSRAEAGDNAPFGGKQVPAQLTQMEYDASHRLTAIRQGPSGGEQRTTQNTYDTASRLLTTTTEGITTAYSYPNYGRDVSATFAYGTAQAATSDTVRFVDGRVKNVTGTAVVPQHHEYGFSSGKFFHRARLLDNNFSTNPGRYQLTTHDLLGRVTESRSNGFGDSDGHTKTLTTYRDYNAKGQLERTYTREGSTNYQLLADQLFVYDEMGALSASGLDVSSGGGLTANSSDRFTEFETKFYKDGSNVWWLRSSQKLYHTNNSTSYHESSTRSRLGNLPSGVNSQTVVTNVHGNTATETVYTNTSAKSHVLVAAMADGSSVERTVIGGFSTLERWFDATDPNRSGTPALATALAYDAQGRALSATDARTGTSRTSYYANTGRPYQSFDARGAATGTYTYDPAGQLATSSSVAGTARFAYNLRGQIVRQWGSAGRPIEYDYNSYGEQTKQWTFRSSADFTQSTWPSSVTGDLTQWTYDTNTGWLVAKTDADGKIVTYSYANTATNRQVTLSRPRAGGAVSTVSHISRSTGDLTKVDYSDGTTDLDYTYTRTGQVASVADVTGTRTFTYTNGQLATEALDATWFHNWRLTPQWQGSGTGLVSGRYAGFTLGTAADPDSELTVTYGYDALGRVNGVTAAYAAQSSPSRSALSVGGTYEYHASSSLWKKLTQGNYTYTRALEPNRDVLMNATAAHSTLGAAPVFTFGYGTDDAGRRTWATQTGVSTDDILPATYYKYAYDSAAGGELISATAYRGTNPDLTTSALPGRAFGYSYDAAGNRLGASVSGDSVSYRSGPSTSDAAGANALNQTRSRGTLKTRVSGTANPAATVTVGGTTASRESPTDRYWDHALTTYGQSTSVSVVATQTGQTTQTQSVSILTRPQNEAFTYDHDGNLLSDSQWEYQWDAENRLLQMTTPTAAQAWGAPNREVFFTYDYMGRRVRKHAKLNGSTVSDRKYLYEGWDLIAEIDNTNGKIVQSYIWGLDPGSGLSGTSAAGALVLETVHTDTTLKAYHVVSDGMGNVTSLVRQSDGLIAAVYEYGPFGERVRAETFDAAVLHQPFRFGTKFTDPESGLVYYGHRYYDATLGRFINRDPIGEAGGNNLYAMVGNGPINGVDVLGLSKPDDVTKMDPFEVNATRINDFPYYPPNASRMWAHDESFEPFYVDATEDPIRPRSTRTANGNKYYILGQSPDGGWYALRMSSPGSAPMGGITAEDVRRELLANTTQAPGFWSGFGARLSNGLAGAGTGAITGATSGGVVGAGVGALFAGVGAGPGAIAGATSGGIAGAIGGFIRGFSAAPETPSLNVAVDAGWHGYMDGALGGMGAPVPLTRSASFVAAEKGTQFTRSSLKLGQEMHKAYKAGLADGMKTFKEFRLPSGRRIDFLDVQKGIIYELKPNNPRAIREGTQQLQNYLREIQSMPQFQGINWQTVLETY